MRVWCIEPRLVERGRRRGACCANRHHHNRHHNRHLHSQARRWRLEGDADGDRDAGAPVEAGGRCRWTSGRDRMWVAPIGLGATRNSGLLGATSKADGARDAIIPFARGGGSWCRALGRGLLARAQGGGSRRDSPYCSCIPLGATQGTRGGPAARALTRDGCEISAVRMGTTNVEYDKSARTSQ